MDTLYKIRLKNKYPAREGISLYNLKNPPFNAIINVRAIATTHTGIKILKDGTVIFCGAL